MARESHPTRVGDPNRRRPSLISTELKVMHPKIAKKQKNLAPTVKVKFTSLDLALPSTFHPNPEPDPAIDRAFADEDEDDDQHSATQVDIEILISEIHGLVRESHNEIRSRMANDEVGSVPGVLLYLLKTPPSSPGHLIESPPISQAQQHLREMEWKSLVQTNRELHDCLRDLDEIKKYWKENQKQHLLKINQIREVDECISDLEAQLRTHRKLKESGPKKYVQIEIYMDNWTREINRRLDTIHGHIIWIAGNREVMKSLFVHFLSLSRQAEEIFDWEIDHEVEQGMFEYEAVEDINLFAWYEEQGVRYWLEPALEDMKLYEKGISADVASLSRGIKHCKERIPRLQALLEKLDQQTLDEEVRVEKEIKKLRSKKNDAGVSEVEAELLESERKGRRVQEDFDYEQDKREFKALKKKMGEKEILLKGGVHLQRKVEIVEGIMRKVLLVLNNRGIDNLGEEWSCMENDMYQIGYVIHYRRVVEEKLQGILKERLLSASKREVIFKKLEEHYDYFIDKHSEELLSWMAKDYLRVESQPDPAKRAVEKLRGIWEEEHEAIENLVNGMEELQRGDDPVLLDRRGSGSSGGRASKGGSGSNDSISWNSFKINRKPKPKPRRYPYTKEMQQYKGRTDMTLVVCRTLLLRKATYEGQVVDDDQPAWVDQLVRTFTSPDIFPELHRNKTAFLRRDLYEWINSFLADPVQEQILDAFMKYCTHFKELFICSNKFPEDGTIRVAAKGWETSAENPIQGLRRKIPLDKRVKPKGIEEVEYWLTEYARTAKPWMKPHEFHVARSWFNRESKTNISDEKWWEFVAHWSLVGKFFVYKDHNQQYLQPNKREVLRVDNGWSPGLFKSKQIFRSIYSESSTLTAPDLGIEKDILYKNIKAFQVILELQKEPLTLTNLFNFVYGTRSQRTEGLNWAYTRQQFFLYLRWTGEQKSENRKFVVYRNGHVTPTNEYGGGPSWGKHSYEK